jgi:hypothetical protein
MPAYGERSGSVNSRGIRMVRASVLVAGTGPKVDKGALGGFSGALPRPFGDFELLDAAFTTTWSSRDQPTYYMR